MAAKIGDVYFIKVGGSSAEERVSALKRLLKKAVPFSEYGKNEIIPVKLTIGDEPCVYHINPELVKVIVSSIKAGSSRPFLFDTSVIYKGKRQNAVDHLTLAHTKGFGHSKVGAPFVIADGVFGSDGKEFTTGAGDINRIKIPSFIGMLDSLVVLSHATGHIVSRYAAAIKNVAMGISCRPTKQVQHSSLKPSVVRAQCTACGCCIVICPVNAISYVKEKADIDQGLCIGCGECICACKFDAMHINWGEDPHIFCRRMAETANFILSKFKNKFFVNFALDITKECDCISTADEPMVSENVGILASTDPVALDRATMDLISRRKKGDYFSHKAEIYEKMFEYAAKIGLGSLEYNLVEVKGG